MELDHPVSLASTDTSLTKSALLRCIALEHSTIEELNKRRDALLNKCREAAECALECESRILDFKKRLDALPE